MKLMKTQDAVGQVLCHDITQIIPGVSKGPVFCKGHVIAPEDVPVLLSVGKDHVYIWENDETVLHENDAAEILRQLCQGAHMQASEPKEGKIELTAACDGLFLVDSQRLTAVNSLGEMMIATRHGGTAVKAGDKLAGTRVIPLVIKKEKMAQARQAAGEKPLLELVPFQRRTYGLVVTGNEVFYGRIQDAFTPVIQQKLEEYGATLLRRVVLGDDPEKITAAIRSLLEEGAGMVLCTGGMSVDPDDRTPLAIRNTGARVVSYGAPVLPGAMFLLAYTADGRPIAGLPGCVMYAKRTIFDLALPWLMAGREITPQWLAGLGEGGLCLGCDPCTYPNCGFGK
ncbi:MAG TPA: molybdopterin-binding protein [Candidatus Anaerotruncus excrementipullorum]|uniref:Molybdopterin molybdenumtransferase n=1 Tax=Candidatus Anaerotruncus excrementipullorum TaxID=2838465 RepID=A0A9D1WTY8_9FIRM|nr:molybdopterin-binding protein [Candidatus Anaerotruncus excrementipullorum]